MESMRDNICERVVPTDIKVFYENGQPYIFYKGRLESRTEDWEIEIPKMDMVLNALEHIVDDAAIKMGDIEYTTIPVCNYVLAEHNINYKLTRIKRKMTKQDIERELGYRVDIVGE